ncbi:acyltransferase domain-containing protein [Candidatus Dependentiae bacterium]|nr:acyltransferase domain-containing protein [Candidatus Dependentiae bacterium]
MNKVVFVYSGFGSQWQGMGKNLYEVGGIFAETIDKIEKIYCDLSKVSIKKLIFSDEPEKTEKSIHYIMAVTAIQIGLTEYLKDYGIKPDCIIGHSLGSVSAAYAAGVIDIQSCLKIIFSHTNIIAEIADKGLIASVSMPSLEIQKIIEQNKYKIEITSINSSEDTLIAGEKKDIEILIKNLKEQSILCGIINTNAALHHSMAKDIVSKYYDSLKDIKHFEPQIPVYCSYTQKQNMFSDYSYNYWLIQLCNGLNFKKTINDVLDKENRIFIEIGPHPTLTEYIRKICIERKIMDYSVFCPMYKEESEYETIAELIVNLQENKINCINIPGNIIKHIDELKNLREKDFDNNTYAQTKSDKKNIFVSLIEQTLKKIIKNPGKNEFDGNTGFFELGLDSAGVIKFTRVISKKIGKKLNAHTAFDYPTINKYADYLTGLAGTE